MSTATPDFSAFFKLADGLRELEVTIGPQARPVIAAVRERLGQAATLRQQGDVPAALDAIRQAMARLAALASELDPAEGMMMKLIAERFSGALDLGDKHVAKETVNFIRHRAGDPRDEPNTDW